MLSHDLKVRFFDYFQKQVPRPENTLNRRLHLKKRKINNDGIASKDTPSKEYSGISRLAEALVSFKQHFLVDEQVQTASQYDRTNFILELRNSMLAQVHQLRHEASLNPHCEKGFNLYRRVQGIGANSLFAPCAVKFLLCQISRKHRVDVFPTTVEKYLLEAHCRHSSVAGRLSKDHGGLDRDRAGSNLKALDSASDGNTNGEVNQPRGSPGKVKEKPLEIIIQYERELCRDALAKVKEAVYARPRHGQSLLVPLLDWHQDVFDSFDDIYKTKGLDSADSKI